MSHDFYSDGTGGRLPRYYDPRLSANVVKVLPGQHYVTDRTDEVLVTVLGSCVAACLRDPAAGLAGMNHFMLPESDSGHWGEEAAALRFGNHAMSQLLAEILWRGGRLDRLEIKLFGGGNMTPGTPWGDRNVAFAERWVQSTGLRLVARHVGGPLPRAIRFFPADGRVLMRLLSKVDGGELAHEDEHEVKAAIAGGGRVERAR